MVPFQIKLYDWCTSVVITTLTEVRLNVIILIALSLGTSEKNLIRMLGFLFEHYVMLGSRLHDDVSNLKKSAYRITFNIIAITTIFLWTYLGIGSGFI